MGYFMKDLIKIVTIFVVVGILAVLEGLWIADMERDSAYIALALKATNERISDLEETSEQTRRQLDACINKVDDLSVAFINNHGRFPRRIIKK